MHLVGRPTMPHKWVWPKTSYSMWNHKEIKDVENSPASNCSLLLHDSNWRFILNAPLQLCVRNDSQPTKCNSCVVTIFSAVVAHYIVLRKSLELRDSFLDGQLIVETFRDRRLVQLQRLSSPSETLAPPDPRSPGVDDVRRFVRLGRTI